MKTSTLAPALALALLSLSACNPNADTANNVAATETLTLNDDDAALGNGDAFEATNNSAAPDNAETPLTDNIVSSAEGDAR